MEYYYAKVKRKTADTWTTWMSLGNIVLNERSQIEKIRHFKILYIKWNIERQKADMWLPGVRNRDWLQMGTRNFLGWWKCSKTRLWWLFHNYKVTNIHQTIHKWAILWNVNYTSKLFFKKSSKSLKFRNIFYKMFTSLSQNV